MTTPTDTSICIGSLVKVIYSVKVEPEDKVDSYLTLFSHFQNDKNVTVECMSKEVNRFLSVVQQHIRSESRAIVEAGLSVLGQMISSKEILRCSQNTIIHNILIEICNILESPHEKSVYKRCFWCLAHQQIERDVVSQHVSKITSIFVDMCSEESKSETTLNEGLKTMKKFCEQCPDEMQKLVEVWLEKIFNLATSTVPKNRDIALEVIEASMMFLVPNHEFACKFLLEQFNDKKLGLVLEDFFHNDVCPVHVLNLWACVLQIIGMGFFELDRVHVTNPLLKIAEKSFASKSSEVTLALNNLWRALIDDVFLRPDEFTRKMEKIFLLPLKIRYRNEVITNESLKTNWHLVCKISAAVNSYVEKIILPMLDVYLLPPEVPKPNVTSASTPEQFKSTARSPKSPHIVTSTKLFAAEILIQLVMEQGERKNVKGFKLECFPGPMLSDENIKQHSTKILEYVMKVTEACAAKHEAKVALLWRTFLVALRKVTHEGDRKKIWCDVLLSIQELVNQSDANITLILKIFCLIPEELLPMTLAQLQDDVNEDGLPCLFIVQLLLHSNIIERSGYEQERFFILYERMLTVLFTGVSDELKHAGVLISFIESANSLITLQDIRWRLWSTLTCQLSDYICKTNNVNEGNAMNYDFSTVLRALTYPLKSINVSQLQDGTIKELMKVWTETYETFCRAVNLLTGVESNVGLEVFFNQLCLLLHEHFEKTDLKASSIVLQMADVAIRCSDFTEIQQLSKQMTPTKMTKKFLKPLGNFSSFIKAVEILLAQYIEQLKEDKAVEKLLFSVTDLLDYFYTGVINDTVISESTRVLSSQISQLLQWKCSAKLLVKLEKLVSVIFNSYESNRKMVFNTELLGKLEDLIFSSIKSERKTMRMRTVKFWNATFGKSANLDYSEKLKNVLINCKTKIVLSLPGVQRRTDSDSILFESQDDTAQFAHFGKTDSPKLKTKSVLSVSPMKIHGSFLQSVAVKNDIKPKLNLFQSPGKPIPNSPINKSLYGPKLVRRKLPISVREESCDFVEIKDSPLKKKRLLTEHQKEMLRERKDLPAMYNNLDQSQDTTLFNSLSQDQPTQLDVLVVANTEKDVEKMNHQEKIKGTSDEESQSLLANMDVVFVKDSAVEEKNVIEDTENMDVTSTAKSDEVGLAMSPEVVPSSQTQDLSQSKSKLNSSLTTQIWNSSKKETSIHDTHIKCSSSDVICLKDVVKSSELLKDHTEEECNESQKSSVMTDSMREVPPLEFMRTKIDLKNPVMTTHFVEKIHSPDIESETSIPEKTAHNTMKNAKRFYPVRREAKIVLQKLPQRHKRKRVNKLAPVSKPKRRKSEGDVLVNNTTCKENSTPNNLVDVSSHENAKIPSPVAGRTRRKDKKPVKHRHSMVNLPSKAVKTSEKIGADSNEIDEAKDDAFVAKETGIVNTNCNTGNKDIAVEKVAQESNLSDGTLTAVKNTTYYSTTTAKPVLCISVVESMKSSLPCVTWSPSSRLQEIPQSPVPGILKKKLIKDGINSPSPPNKSRRVSFQLPEGAKVLKEDNETTKSDNESSITNFTSLKHKLRAPKASSNVEEAVFPDLVTCTVAVEKVLPSLTYSRGMGHVMIARNILTVGDLSSLSKRQIEHLPIRSPKVETVRKALRQFSTLQSANEKSLPKSPLNITRPKDKSMMDSATPPKDESLAKEAALLVTPSRHLELVKPTSLFTEGGGALPTSPKESSIKFPINKDITDNQSACDELMSSGNGKFDFGDVAPSSLQNDVTHEDASDEDKTNESDEPKLNECDVKTLLSKIDFTGLSTTTIFDVVSELDKLKATAMEELKTRMTSKH